MPKSASPSYERPTENVTHKKSLPIFLFYYEG
jgi:hypothetical protein